LSEAYLNVLRAETSGSGCDAARESDITIVMPATAANQRTTPKALVRRARDATRANASMGGGEN
jgi:hypothetical protein